MKLHLRTPTKWTLGNFQLKFLQTALILSVGAFSHFASAANEMQEMGSCGSAKVVSGDTCSNVKVDMDFSGCTLKSEHKLAGKVVCEGNKIKARYQEGNYRYEAEFSKENDGWGGVTWKSLGAVKQWQRKEARNVAAAPVPATDLNVAAAPAPVIATAPAAEPAPAPVMPPTLSASSSAPESAALPLKISGFVDFRFTSIDAKKNPSWTKPHAESGFAIEDGALYISSEKDKFSVLADIAIRRQKDGDRDSVNGTAATYPAQSNNNNFAVGVAPSQLLMRYKATDSFSVVLGQFDTIYGVELNDSKDRVFGKSGLVYDLTLPVTHAGAMLEFATNGFSAKLLGANPNNKGTFGTSADNDENTEYGAAFGYSNELARVQVGYMTRPMTKVNGIDKATRSLLDVTAGTTLGNFTLDIELAQVTDPVKNTLTPLDSADTEKAGTGMFLLATFKVMDELLLGARYESISDDPARTALKSATSIGASVHYKITPEFEARTEYIGNSYKDVGATTKRDDSRISIGALATF